MSVELFAKFLRMELSVTQICELVPSTESMEDGRVLTELEKPAGLRISPVQADPQLFVEKNQRQGVVNNEHTLLAQLSLVSVLASAGRGHSPIIDAQSQPSLITTGGMPTVNTGRIDAANRLETLRNCLGAQGLPPEVVELLLATTRSN
jgi:hypothetical protein